MQADEVVCLEMPGALTAIGLHYRDFHQMSDVEVTDLLARAAHANDPPLPPGAGGAIIGRGE